MSLVNNSLVELPTTKSISYSWNFGMARDLYYRSFNFRHVRRISCTILLLTIGTAFLGYVLPWGQMRFWGATVITNLVCVIPKLGVILVNIFWGGFAVDNTSLTRFFTLHFLLPFSIVGVRGLHLFFSCFKNGGFTISYQGYLASYTLISFFLLVRLFQLGKLISGSSNGRTFTIGFQGLYIFIGTLLLILTILQVVINTLWEHYYISFRKHVYFTWFLCLIVWCIFLGVVFFLSLRELVQIITLLGVGGGGNLPPSDPNSTLVATIVLLNRTEYKLKTPYHVFDGETGQILEYRDGQRYIFKSQHKGGVVRYQLTFSELKHLDLFATTSYLDKFKASIYSNPSLYNIQAKVLTTDSSQISFGLEPMLRNSVFISKNSLPVVHRPCLLKGTWANSPSIWVHLLVRSSRSPLLTVVPAMNFYPSKGILYSMLHEVDDLDPETKLWVKSSLIILYNRK